MIAFSQYKNEISDAEIIKRAEALGMVMKEDSLFHKPDSEMNTEAVSENIDTEDEVQEETEVVTETEIVTENETETETVAETEMPTELPTETETEAPTETEIADETANDNKQEGTYHLVIASGAIPRLICAELEENGVVESAASLRKYLTDVGFVKNIIVGEYDIPYGSTNEEVYRILKNGS